MVIVSCMCLRLPILQRHAPRCIVFYRYMPPSLNITVIGSKLIAILARIARLSLVVNISEIPKFTNVFMLCFYGCYNSYLYKHDVNTG